MSIYPLLDKYPLRTQEEIGARLAVVPNSLKQIYLLKTTNRTLEKVAEKHGLDFDQAGVMGNVVDEVLLKFVPLNELPAALTKHLEIDSQKAQTIAADLNQELFNDVKADLAGETSVREAEIPTTNKFSSLPADVQAAIKKLNITEEVKAIGENNHLHIDQMGKLDEEIEAVLARTTPADQFSRKLQMTLGLDAAAAEVIAKEVNERVFLPIRKTLQESTTSPKPKPPTEPKGIFEEKMGQQFRIPREEVELDPYNEPLK